MKKRVFSTGTVIALMVAVSISAAGGVTPSVAAEKSLSHAGHDHDHGKKPASPHEEEEHGSHAHADADAEESHEEHAGHGHEEKTASHAGHGHGGHDDHGGEGGICPEHGVPEAEDALCHGDHLGELRPGEGMMVRLASPDVAARAGVGFTEPQKITIADGIDIPGRVEFNRDRLARISPLSAGVVQRVRVRPGAEVHRGDLLAEIATPEITSLQARFLAAEARLKQTEAAHHREKDLLERGISSRQEFQQADAEFRAAQSASAQYRQQLLNYGFSQADIRRMARDGANGAVVALRAPFDGSVVEVKTAAGEAVEPGIPLFTVADLDPLWIEISIPESRIYQARVDAPVQARFDGLPGTVFIGRVFQVGASLDERTRTLKILAEMENPDHRLRVGMFGSVRILEGHEEQVLAVPADALQSIDGASYVFVRQEPDLFELRRVEAGSKSEGLVPILAGLSPGEQVVASQGFALKSEVLKARLGASCADH